ncbi:MAG: type II toxin-antitoxin system VapC family toxin [Acidobacteriota bacterium]|nr:type II toxin-antitoxin system VapC family toxin [Acidobacteriota bacterium]
MTFLLDTDTCSFLMKRSSRSLIDKVQQFAPGELKVSTVTVYELEHGLQRRPEAHQLHRVVNAFLHNVEVLPFDAQAARHAGAIRAHLERAGTPIGAYDLLIAGHARSAGATLVSHNLREFQRVPELSIADWALDL